MGLADANLALGRWLRRFALYSFAGDLYRGRRILEVGCDSGAGCAYLMETGAAHVIGVDLSADAINTARGQFSAAQVEFRCEDAAQLQLDDGSIDCIFVPEGAKLLRRYAVIDELRRVLAKSGNLVWSAPSADRPNVSGGASFFEFADRLEAQFGAVRMIAQSPFTAISLADYQPEAHGVTLETSLLDLAGSSAGDVTEYVALAGPGAEVSRGFYIAQTPLADGLIAAQRSLSGTNQVTGIFTGDELAAEKRLRQRAESQIVSLRSQDASGSVAASASPRDQTVILQPAHVAALAPPPDETAFASDPARVAAAFAEHARRMDAARDELSEARAYQEELLDELAELREGEQGRRDYEAKLESLRHEVRSLRDALATREGEVLGVRARAHERCAEYEETVAALRDQLTQARIRGGLDATRDRKLVDATGKLAHAEALLAEQDLILGELEGGVAALLVRANEGNLLDGERSGLNAEQQHQLNSIASEIGSRDAEVTLLTVGLKSLRARIAHVARKLDPVCEKLNADGNASVAEVVAEVAAELRRYSH